MVFLGDYTDRGSYGVEVMYVLMRLKVENPDQVWMARGNHEDILIDHELWFSERPLPSMAQPFLSNAFPTV